VRAWRPRGSNTRCEQVSPSRDRVDRRAAHVRAAGGRYGPLIERALERLARAAEARS
jgi:hypothetical protein